MKNSLIKRIAAVAFAAATILTCAPTTSLAATPTIDPGANVKLIIEKHTGTDTGLNSSVTGEQNTSVSGELLSGVKFTAVKVAEIQQTSAVDGNVKVEYKLTADGAALLGGTSNDVKSGKELNDIVKVKETKDFDFDQTTTEVSAITDTNGQAVFTSDNATNTSESVVKIEGQGLYLVVETGSPAEVTDRSHPFLVSLPMTNKVDANDWMYDVYVYPKNRYNTTSIDKKIQDVDGVADNVVATDKEHAEATIGDIITYNVPITAIIPDGGLKKLGITDTMSKGLTFVTASEQVSATDVDVYAGNTADEKKKLTADMDYSVEATTETQTGITTLKVYFTQDYITKLNNAIATEPAPNFLFVYKAKLNKDAILGQTGNENSVKLVYNYNNNPTPNQDVESLPEKTYVYTWGIDLTKQGDDNKKLANVEFELRTEEKNAASAMKFNVTDATKNIYTRDDNGSAILKTNTEGKLYVNGLESGTYYLVETKTNLGYTLLKDAIKIVITGNEADGSATATVGDKAVVMNADGISSLTALLPITVINNTGFDLPATGGAGTALFTIAGIAIVAVAAALLLMRKKSNK